MSIKSLEHLDDYVTGSMSDDDAAAFEEELFAAAAATGEADEARWFERFQLLVGYLAQGDVLVRGTTSDDVDALVKGGSRVHVVKLEPGIVPYESRSDIDIVVTHVPVDVRDYESVEATIENPDGRVLHTFRDCIGDPKTGHLYAICAAPLANKAWSGGPRVGRVTGVKRGETERRELALYRLEPVSRRPSEG